MTQESKASRVAVGIAMVVLFIAFFVAFATVGIAADMLADKIHIIGEGYDGNS